ncbi:methionine--tRNA ligase [Candidatus Woesearchaeota archaeon]|nr:methionine--tRNA ligase [Candidatus Woesearchaeota archaeon]
MKSYQPKTGGQSQGNAKPVIITAALPYANGSIHIGHLFEYIQTDQFARILKLQGRNVKYCCADDTHGAPIDIKAKQLGISPEELISRFAKEHQRDFADYGIKFDSYYSTNSPENKWFSDYIFTKLKDNGHVYEKTVEQIYCPTCKRFLPDRFVKGKCPKCGAPDQYGDVCENCHSTHDTKDLIDPYCSICRSKESKPELRESKHFFFQLSKFSEELKEWITNHEGIQKEIKNQMLGFIDQGLNDWCISRDPPYFGFKIPRSDKYYYVWLDAPIGYISSYANSIGKKEGAVLSEWNVSEIIHDIGKDIVYFHLLFWPAMLHAAGIKRPDKYIVHGFVNVNKEKMSKSRGTFLTAAEFKELTDPQLLRFYFASKTSVKVADIDLDLEDFVEKINSELVSNVANFIYRCTSFLHKHFDGKTCASLDAAFLESQDKLACDILEHYNNFDLQEAVKNILTLSSQGNKYFQDNKPWNLVKENPEKAEEVLSTCLTLASRIIVLLKPIIPNLAGKWESQLNITITSFSDLSKKLVGHKINQPEIILRKLEPIKVGKDSEKNTVENKTPGFEILDLKVGIVRKAEPHPDADKLLVLQVDLGSKQIQLVAGIKRHYSLEEVIGKHIVVVSNLEPAELRGKKSEGMLLAASKDDIIGLLETPLSSAGEQVFIEGVQPSNTTITIKDFSQLKITVKAGKVVFQDKQLKTAKENIRSDKVSDGRVS